jgi:hypothetical protein
VIEGVRFAHSPVCQSTFKWHCTSVGNVVVPQATMFPRYTHTTAHRHSHHCHWCAAQSVHTHPPQARHFPPVLSLLKLANTHIQPLSTSTNGCAALRSPAHPTTFHHFHFHQWLRSSQIACSSNHFPPLPLPPMAAQLAANERIMLASTFHGLSAIAGQLSPGVDNSGIQVRYCHCTAAARHTSPPATPGSDQQLSKACTLRVLRNADIPHGGGWSLHPHSLCTPPRSTATAQRTHFAPTNFVCT